MEEMFCNKKSHSAFMTILKKIKFDCKCGFYQSILSIFLGKKGLQMLRISLYTSERNMSNVYFSRKVNLGCFDEFHKFEIYSMKVEFLLYDVY